MKVVGIVGSPRVGGNTEALTRMALEEIRKEGLETELISLAGKRIEPCDGCRRCSKTGKCHIKDDFESVFTTVSNDSHTGMGAAHVSYQDVFFHFCHMVTPALLNPYLPNGASGFCSGLHTKVSF